MELTSVAAIAENLAIGKDGEIPWPSLPADRRQYRARIADSPVILGRVTFESMLDDLPGAAQIVLSRRDPSYDIETAVVVETVEAAIETASDLAADVGADTAYVIGGAGIYESFQPHLDRMILTRVPGEYEADAFYPEWEPAAWSLARRTEYEDFDVEEWVRRE